MQHKHLFIANTLGYAISDFSKNGSIRGMSYHEALAKAYAKQRIDMDLWAVVASVNNLIMSRDYEGFKAFVIESGSRYGLAVGEIGQFLTHCIFVVDPKFRDYARKNTVV